MGEGVISPSKLYEAHFPSYLICQTPLQSFGDQEWRILWCKIFRQTPFSADNQGLTSTRYPTLPRFFFTSRTLPGIFLKISGFRVVSKIYKIDKFSKLSPSLRYENLCDNMINGIPATTQHNKHNMTERSAPTTSSFW